MDEQPFPAKSGNIALDVILGHSAQMTDAAVFIWRTLAVYFGSADRAG